MKICIDIRTFSIQYIRSNYAFAYLVIKENYNSNNASYSGCSGLSIPVLGLSLKSSNVEPVSIWMGDCCLSVAANPKSWLDLISRPILVVGSVLCRVSNWVV